MPKSRPPYPDEFRDRAVQLVRSTDESIPRIADDLGISHQTLRNWVHQADVDGGKREGLTTEEREELRRPRSQRAQRDVLILDKIRCIHKESRETYGAPRIHFELADEHNFHCGRKRVARSWPPTASGAAAGAGGTGPPQRVRVTWWGGVVGSTRSGWLGP